MKIIQRNKYFAKNMTVMGKFTVGQYTSDFMHTMQNDDGMHLA